MNGQPLERPIDNPDYDLLGMASYADNLAQFIRDMPPPITIGIYGEWGSGKSSYVELLRFYLQQKTTRGEPEKKLKFIAFSAWDYTSADELWRALILRIAMCLYDKPDNFLLKQQQQQGDDQKDQAGADRDGSDSGLLSALATFFSSKPFRPRNPPSAPDKDAEFKEIVAQIDSKLYANISRDPQKDLQLNQEATFGAIVQAIMAAVGTVSPLVAGIGRLFDKKQIAPADLVQEATSQVSRDTIKSIQEFRQLLDEHFKPAMQKDRVMIFVDDLDRCLPNVALDLLEAIKIFLGGLPCVFIIAADRQLVGQGLRLRYRDLFSAGDPLKAEELLARKGQEYFEKIIQFGMPVPPRTPQQAHRFISAQFPQWTAATDLVQAVIGTNPRRLKQYCQRLGFNYSVYQKNRKSGVQVGEAWRESVKLLEKCVELKAWKEPCYMTLRNLLDKDPDGFRSSMTLVEEWIAKSKEDEPLEVALQALLEADSKQLYESAVALNPLYRLFQSTPRFSAVEMPLMDPLVQLADTTPDSLETLRSKDSFFMRILKPVFQNSSVQADQLLQTDLATLFSLYDLNPNIVDTLVRLAGRASFNTEMKKVEARLEGKADPAELMDAEFQKLADQVGELSNVPVKDIFLGSPGSPRFSDMLRQEILLFKESKPANIAKEANTQTARPSLGVLEEFIKSLPEEELGQVKTASNLRIDVARYYLELRKFAKLRGLEEGWPKLHERLLIDRAEVVALEEAAQPLMPGAQASVVQISEDLQPLLKDRALMNFLRLLPRFRYIDVGELADYAATMQAVPTLQPPLSADVSLPSQNKIGAEKIAVTENAAALGSSLKGAEAPDQLPFDIFDLVIRQEGDQSERYTVTASSSAGQATANVLIDWGKIHSKFQYTQEARPAGTRATRLLAQRDLASQNFRWPQLTHELIREVGTLICNQFFTGDVYNLFLATLSNTQRELRLIFNLDENDSSLRELPWEALYISRLSLHPALNQRYSLMRLASPHQYLEALEIVPPLRILAALSSPKNLPPLNVSGELEILQKALAPARDRGAVEVHFLEAATASRLQQSIRSFRPHLVHFVVHGHFDPTDNTGYLMLEDEQGTGKALTAEDIKVVLADSDVRAVVLNGCETSSTYGGSDYASSVAGSLVDAGVPFVIGTMRPILDAAALLFSREFYRSFASGYSLENALTEARKAMSIEKYDWSAYAFYTIADQIESFRLAGTSYRAERGEERLK